MMLHLFSKAKEGGSLMWESWYPQNILFWMDLGYSDALANIFIEEKHNEYANED